MIAWTALRSRVLAAANIEVRVWRRGSNSSRIKIVLPDIFRDVSPDRAQLFEELIVEFRERLDLLRKGGL